MFGLGLGLGLTPINATLQVNGPKNKEMIVKLTRPPVMYISLDVRWLKSMKFAVHIQNHIFWFSF